VAACGVAAVDNDLVPRLRRSEYLDVHHLCNTLNVLCASDAVSDSRRILDALSLIELDEAERARALLEGVSQKSPDPRARRWASVVITWSFLRQRDEAAFRGRLATLPDEARGRLELLARAPDEAAFGRQALGLGLDATSSDVGKLAAAYRTARRTKRPWLAGVLSAVLPGAGQVYAGSWQGAAVAFVLNATLIGATAELATRRLYLPAAATGLAASFFYVGNIVNAADLAGRRNEMAAAEPYRALETRLVPEAHP
jgi:hypothetical protein